MKTPIAIVTAIVVTILGFRRGRKCGERIPTERCFRCCVSGVG